MRSETDLVPREPAEYLRTSVSTFAKRILHNDAPKLCRIGTAIRYRKSDLDEFMSQTRVPSPPFTVEEGDR
jgi:predicted DNA-binding transcriptional regulator AlpA